MSLWHCLWSAYRATANCAPQRSGWAEVSTLLGVGNVAEIEFYRNGIRVTGADYGTRGSWNNNGKTSQKALDGDVHTRFDGPSPNGIYVGIASSSPATNLSARK
jgi:hypothetical protein